MKRKLSIIISLLIGAAVFGFFLHREGVSSVFSIFLNVKPIYLGLYFFLSTLTFLPTTWRWAIILKTHGAKVPFFSLLRYTISGYAISYVTPSAKVGGEPLKAYMVYKENGVDLKTASSSLILEKFVELSGSAVFGLVGILLFLFLPGVPFWLKFVLGGALVLAFLILVSVYYRSVIGKGFFSSLFIFFRLNKIFKKKDFVDVLKDVEKKMHYFFLTQRKAFLLTFFTFFIYAVLVILEYKFLLLGIGFDESLRTVILVLVIAGFAGFVPIPANLGFLEAGQSALFSAVRGSGSIGFALSLVVRFRALIFTALGFSMISYFSAAQLADELPKIQEKI